MNHTPGPWTWAREEEVSAWSLGPGVLLTDYADGTPDGDELDRANARLIAAAPELLECLKAAMQIIGHPDDSFSKLAASVIAKAEGK